MLRYYQQVPNYQPMYYQYPAAQAKIAVHTVLGVFDLWVSSGLSGLWYRVEPSVPRYIKLHCFMSRAPAVRVQNY